MISTFTRIHRSDKHKIRRILDRSSNPRDHNSLVFDGLPQYFQHFPREFSQFVKKQNPLVRETHLARSQIRSSTRDRDLRRGVVNLPKRSFDNQGRIFIQFSDHRIDLTDFQDFLEPKGRENTLEGLAEHGLSTSWGAHHDDVVQPCSSDGKRPFG